MKPRTLGRRVLAAAGLTAALVVPVALFTGSGAAESSTAAQAQYAPRNTSSPTVSGSAQEGSTLTANSGSWSSSTDVSYSYQWQRCNSKGAACSTLNGADGQTYNVGGADVGNTLRVVVTARNKDGSASAISNTTGVVAAKGTQGNSGGSSGSVVAIGNVNPPDRLVIDKVSFSPSPVKSLGPIQARFHVTDTQSGKPVDGALVYAIGLPYSRVTTAPEIKTGADGWATMTFQPAKFFPRKGYVVFFVRARAPGDNLLAGVSTRRLVQMTVSR